MRCHLVTPTTHPLHSYCIPMPTNPAPDHYILQSPKQAKYALAIVVSRLRAASVPRSPCPLRRWIGIVATRKTQVQRRRPAGLTLGGMAWSRKPARLTSHWRIHILLSVTRVIGLRPSPPNSRTNGEACASTAALPVACEPGA